MPADGGGSAGAPGGAAMWGGRFASGPDALFRALNDSLGVDWRFVRQDIAGSIAWAEGLGRAGVLSDDEVGLVVGGLARLAREAASLPGPPFESGAEDVHTWVEQRLTASLEADGHAGLGKKLHTGRSRNDQVATDFRLWAIEALGGLVDELDAARRALTDLAERSAGVAMPAYTHLQVAQPVLAGHWCLAYEAMLSRDAGRLIDAMRRADACPLGCAALAGTTYAVGRAEIAARLGFSSVCGNSLDAVSDRDFVLEALSAVSLCGLHLSRLGEDLIVYASSEFGLVELGDEVCSGSSLMPQKKNPDGLELLRGKAGRLFGELASLSMTVKGLPLSYNKDLQEDKRPLFTAADELSLCLRLLVRTLEGMRFVPERCAAAAMAGGSNATELADYLVAKGVPFREAHEVVGRAVRASIEAGVGLESMPVERLAAIDPRIGADAGAWLGLKRMLERRDQPGGTAPGRVAEAMAAARASLGSSAERPRVSALVLDPASAGSGSGSGGGGGGAA